MKVYITDDDHRCDYSTLPDCKYSLCYINLALISHKFIKKHCEFESKGYEFFVNLTKKNLSTGEESQIGSFPISPLNYCTPFEKNNCTLYLNFFSLNELVKYLEGNEIIASLKFRYDIERFEVLYYGVVNYFVKPVTSIQNKLILSNNSGDFKVNLNINVEWYAIIPNNRPGNVLKNLEENERKAPISFNFRNTQKRMFRDISITGLPDNIYPVYEKAICNDPIASRNVANLQPKLVVSSNQVDSSKYLCNNTGIPPTSVGFLNKLGGWTVNVKDLILSEKGFIHLYDMFPKYRQAKSFKVVVQHCIKNRDGNILTHIRRHLSVMSFLKGDFYPISYKIPYKHYYTAKANVYSRIPEIITNEIEEVLFYIIFSIPNSTKLIEAGFDENPIFYGELSPSEISVNDISIVKLYSELNDECLGYALVLFSNIKENPIIDINCCNIINKSPEIKDQSKIKHNVMNHLEEISIVYLYMYWHIQARSINDKKTPESILLELYSRISNSRNIEGKVNIIGINKCIDALIPSSNKAFQSLKDYTCCIPENVVLFNNVKELKHYLQFPHLEIFENSYIDIFPSDNLKVLEESEFINKCNELGIRASISNTWREMIKFSFTNISMKTYKMCLQLYKVENILF